MTPHLQARDAGRRRQVDELHEALTQLRSYDSQGPQSARAWAVVEREARRLLPKDPDARQDALVAIYESVHTVRAPSPPSAAAWLRAVCRNRLVDGLRRRRGGRSLDSGDPAALGEEPLPVREAASAVIAAFLARVEVFLASKHPVGNCRSRRRLHAIVALRRIALEQPLAEIAHDLGLSVTDDLLAKWVERGRAVIVATVAHDRVVDPDAAELFAPFAELALTRRADAGRPRPNRRRRPA